MVFATERLDVVLHYHAAANDFDIDGHSLAVWRGGEPGGDMRWRAGLVFLLREAKAPRRNIDLLNWSAEDGVKLESTISRSFIYRFSLFGSQKLRALPVTLYEAT